MTDKLYDIAILGAGPAGGNAAIAAAAQGMQVVLLDEQPQAGGQVWRAKSAAILDAPATPESRAGADLRVRLSASGVTHLAAARVWHMACVDKIWTVDMVQGGVTRRLRARALILAVGAREVVQPVPGWTTPGVIGLAGATALFKQNMMVPGKRTVVSGTGPLVFYVAGEIRRLGGVVAAVVTPNTRMDWLRAMPAMLRKPGLLARGAWWLADLTAARVPVYWGHAVTQVSGGDRVAGVSVARSGGRATQIAADSLCLGHGLIPQIEAAQMLGVGIHHDPALGGWVPDVTHDGATDVPQLYLCGDGTGMRGAAAAVAQGELVGLRVASDLGADTSVAQARARSAFHAAARFGLAMTRLGKPAAELSALATDDTIICRCEGLTRRDVLAEVRRGAASTNAVKSGVRAGMGTCGGKFCQTAVAALIAAETGRAMSDIAPPTARSPLRPVPLAAAAGVFDYDDLPIPKPAPL